MQARQLRHPISSAVRDSPEMNGEAVTRKRGDRFWPLLLITLLLASSVTCGCLEELTIPSIGNIPLPSMPGATDGKLRAYFLDVGQGDSSVILFGNRTVLIDAGEREYGDVVVDDLRALGVDHIDLLVATHPHSDHIGGMQEVLSSFPVTEVLDSGLPHTSSLYENFLDEIQARHINYSVARRGDTIDLDDLRIFILSPPDTLIGDDLNDNSVVLRVSYGTFNLLFTGDAGKTAESQLVKTGYALDADVLKVSHHGSSDATGSAFLTRVDPDIAVISVGSENEYGHPHAETIDRLEATGVKIYRTDIDGTILVVSDGSSFSVKTTAAKKNPLTLAPSEVATKPTATPAGTTTFSLPSFQVGNASGVAIAATRFNAKGDDRLNLNGEWVQLRNSGNESVLLAGWTLSDNSGETVYTFPLFILDPDKRVTIYTGSGEYNDTALFMGKSEPVWGNSGDIAILKDGSGTVIDRESGG